MLAIARELLLPSQEIRCRRWSFCILLTRGIPNFNQFFINLKLGNDGIGWQGYAAIEAIEFLVAPIHFTHVFPRSNEFGKDKGSHEEQLDQLQPDRRGTGMGWDGHGSATSRAPRWARFITRGQGIWDPKTTGFDMKKYRKHLDLGGSLWFPSSRTQ